MREVDPTFLGKLEIAHDSDVFCYYDGPLSWLTRQNERMFYCHWGSVSSTSNLYLVREVSYSELDDLLGNRTPLLDFLNSASPLYLAMYGPTRLKVFVLDGIPAGWGPQPGVMLLRD